MLVKCIDSFEVEICDGNGFSIPNELFIVDENTIWSVDKEAHILNGDLRLIEIDTGNNWLEVPNETYNAKFKPIKCSYCNKLIVNEDNLVSLDIENEIHHFHKECEYIPLKHLLLDI